MIWKHFSIFLSVFGLVLLAWSIHANSGVAPDADVIATAKQVGEGITISKSQYAWMSGCDRSDSRVYRVYKAGKQVAIVCQGSVIQPFGIPTKAPTLRYKAE